MRLCVCVWVSVPLAGCKDLWEALSWNCGLTILHGKWVSLFIFNIINSFMCTKAFIWLNWIENCWVLFCDDSTFGSKYHLKRQLFSRATKTESTIEWWVFFRSELTTCVMCVNGSLFWGRGPKSNSGFVIISQRDLPKKLSSITYQLRTIPLQKKTGKNFPPFSHSHFKFIWLKKKSKGNPYLTCKKSYFPGNCFFSFFSTENGIKY